MTINIEDIPSIRSEERQEGVLLERDLAGNVDKDTSPFGNRTGLGSSKLKYSGSVPRKNLL